MPVHQQPGKVELETSVTIIRQRIKRSLFANSHEKSQLNLAICEWQHCYDYETFDDCDGVCELCGKTGLRFRFLISNSVTDSHMWIGSECIRKFKHSNGAERDDLARAVDASRRLATRQYKDDQVTTQLLTLACVDAEFDIEEFLEYWEDRGAFTPNQLSLLAWRFSEADVAFSTHCFRLTIRHGSERDQLRKLPQWRLLRIWASLSSYQKSWCRRHRDDGNALPFGQKRKGR